MATELSELQRYHEVTKHSRASVRLSRHFLDWANKPLAFKVYTDLKPIQPLEDIGRLCLLSNGVLRWRRFRGGEPFGFRAAPCTGALYHVELYIASGERPDLSAGLYHYGAHVNAVEDPIIARLGGRGYRVAQMVAGIAGARVELRAAELGPGATGLTFFDDEVTDFFEPASRRRQVMYLVAVGRTPVAS
jgi:hypothetical protein